MTDPKRQRLHAGESLSLRRLRGRIAASTAPGVLWLAAFFTAPLLVLLVISFWSRGEYGTIERAWTWENYKRLAGFGWLGYDSVYPVILLRSLLLGFATGLLCAMAGLPLAFFIARLKGVHKWIALVLVVIPLWTNLLIRTYAWQILLGPNSWLTQLCIRLDWLEPNAALYPSTFAVCLCLVCDFLPFMVLPLYASTEKLDWALVEAAKDLGAGPWAVFWHAIWPQIRPGLAAGFVLVFLPATGQFVIPDLLGGAKSAMLGNLLQQQFGPSLDWPFGSAIAVLCLILVLAGLWIHSRQSRASEMPW